MLAPNAWRLARLSVLFVFDVTRISRGDGDLLEPLLLTAILQANQSVLPSRPDLQIAYGDEVSALPDEHRRPISVSALAQSLGLPFETVRRRTQALAARGLCVTTPGGLYVPQAAVASPGYAAVLTARAARLSTLCGDLVAEGLQAPTPGLAAFVAETPRAADRVLGDYMLRICEGLLDLTGSAMDGIVLLALCAGNIRELDLEQVAGWDRYGDLAQTCSATALSQALGMPGETVRRHLHRLARSGFARQKGRGWIADAGAASRPKLGRLVEANAQNLRRMLAALADLAGRSSVEAARRA